MEVLINQRDKKEDLFTSLQGDAIHRLELLSGKVWTDFNAHDPGITLLDILNYALTELDYKLRFPLVDYLTARDGTFRPEEFGLFSPAQVFPVNPVTPDDYRKLFLMQIPQLENVWIDVNKKTGSYFIHLKLFDFIKEAIPEEIKRKVEKLYMSHRNLCEDLEGIDFIFQNKVYLEGEVNICPGVDVTAVLVDFYHCALDYLAMHVSYDSYSQSGIAPDEWLDGPNDGDIRVSTMESGEVRTETGLYHQLCRIPGVKSLYSFYIRAEDGHLINRFEIPYSLLIPQSLMELNKHLSVKVDGVVATIRFEYFISGFDVANMNSGNYMKIISAEKFNCDHPTGDWRAVYNHTGISKDFPDCYGVNANGLGGFVDPERKGKAMQLKAYLGLFDLVFTRGLKELEEFKNVLKLDNGLSYTIFSPDEPVKDFLVDTTPEALKDFADRDVTHLKSRLLDMLDAIYGEDSDPDWLYEYNYYDDTEAIRIRQRVEFLKKIPYWGRDRFRACDLTGEQDGQNIPGLKAYVSTLLNWQYDEGSAVGNIFPAYNLTFIPQKEYELSRMVKSDLIQEQMLSQYNIEPVSVSPGSYTEADYEEMRKGLPYFYNNLLSDELFREGIYRSNYRIVHISEKEVLLVFRDENRKVWMTLGRSMDQEKLIRMANVMRDFLLKLNRESETMYMVENQFFVPKRYFSVTVVLAGWSARMANPRFREICRRLILSRLPVHIQADFQWLGVDDMQKFEIAWRKWRKYTQMGNREDAGVVMKEIQEIFEKDQR